MRFFIFLLSLPLAFSAYGAEKTLKVGSSPVISSAGIYLALDQGYFKEQNLNVEVIDVPTSGAAMTLLLASGKMDVGAGNLTSGLFNAMLSGQKIKLVADKGHLEEGRSYIGLLVRHDLVQSGRYKTLKDLKGFKLALTSLDGVSQQILTERFLKKGGLSEKDITYVKMSYAEMNVALKNKLIDGAVQLEPFLTKAKLEKVADLVAPGVEVHPHQQSAALLYSPALITKDYETGVKFMVAYLKGVRLYNRSLRDETLRKKVRASLQKHIKIEDPRIWEQMIPIGLADDGRLNGAALMEDIQWYRQKGYVKKDLKESDLVDARFVKAADQILAKEKN
jgi:NitT/TauT family transport system substrate-binding protein